VLFPLKQLPTCCLAAFKVADVNYIVKAFFNQSPENLRFVRATCLSLACSINSSS
jgi:hypothetical protein